MGSVMPEWKQGRQFLHPLLGAPGGRSSSLWAAACQRVWLVSGLQTLLLLPRPPVSWILTHTPHHPRPLLGSLSLPGLSLLPRHGGGTRYRDQKISLTVDQITLGIPQSGCHILALFYLLIFFFFFYWLCFNPALLPVICFSGLQARRGSQNRRKQDAWRLLVLGSSSNCQMSDGDWWTTGGSKRMNLCSGCLPLWVPSWQSKKKSAEGVTAWKSPWPSRDADRLCLFEVQSEVTKTSWFFCPEVTRTKTLVEDTHPYSEGLDLWFVRSVISQEPQIKIIETTPGLQNRGNV